MSRDEIRISRSPSWRCGSCYQRCLDKLEEQQETSPLHCCHLVKQTGGSVHFLKNPNPLQERPWQQPSSSVVQISFSAKHDGSSSGSGAGAVILRHSGGRLFALP
ncbi:hypothetical protein FisN_2Lu330 [Fistulifera solaris]|uniref:Uncharacterized protein n=1 Tax=Fistulifera solaris TaxID=1519565 RepID=A0A1Z5KGD9_FISSO|nr:hypothetical protein FisN_2Lu330 [Fistulifera solaris]|eukprot:GAX25038.1 hypothetical protein FisN_2Lu330 [Fistulifera solaris]